jgi:hypothetical protein
MRISLFGIIVVLITAAAFASEVYSVAMLALLLGIVGVFIKSNYDHPAVREWLEKIF